MLFHRKTNPNVIALAGTWDPPLPRHIALLKQLLHYSRKKGLNPCVLIFHPNPANLLYENKYKEYFDIDARLALLSRLGINNVVVAEFAQPDLKRSSVDFLDQLLKSTGMSLKELWVGESQQMGTGAEGLDAIAAACAARNIWFRRLKNSFRVDLDKEDIRPNFRADKFELTKAAIGYYPTFKLNTDNAINMYDGHYHAKLRTDPFIDANELAASVNIAEGRMEAIERPDGYDWLVLTASV